MKLIFNQEDIKVAVIAVMKIKGLEVLGKIEIYENTQGEIVAEALIKRK